MIPSTATAPNAQPAGELTAEPGEPDPFCLRILAISQGHSLSGCDVIKRAVSLAEMCRVQLTIAAVTDPGRLVRWAGVGPFYANPVYEYDWWRRDAERQLLEVTRSVPSSVSVRTVVMLPKTRAAVRQILDEAPHDLVVVRRGLLTRDVLLRRALSRAHVSVLALETPASHAPLRARRALGSRSHDEVEKYMRAAE